MDRVAAMIRVMPVMVRVMVRVMSMMCVATFAALSPVCRCRARDHHYQRNRYKIVKHLNPLLGTGFSIRGFAS